MICDCRDQFSSRITTGFTRFDCDSPILETCFPQYDSFHLSSSLSLKGSRVHVCVGCAHGCLCIVGMNFALDTDSMLDSLTENKTLKAFLQFHSKITVEECRCMFKIGVIASLKRMKVLFEEIQVKVTDEEGNELTEENE